MPGSALRRWCSAHEVGRRPCDQRRRSPPVLPSRDGADRAALGCSGCRTGIPRTPEGRSNGEHRPGKTLRKSARHAHEGLRNDHRRKVILQAHACRFDPRRPDELPLLALRASSSLGGCEAPRRYGFVAVTGGSPSIFPVRFPPFHPPRPAAPTAPSLHHPGGLPGSTVRRLLRKRRTLETRHAPPEGFSRSRHRSPGPTAAGGTPAPTISLKERQRGRSENHPARQNVSEKSASRQRGHSSLTTPRPDPQHGQNRRPAIGYY